MNQKAPGKRKNTVYCIGLANTVFILNFNFIFYFLYFLKVLYISYFKSFILFISYFCSAVAAGTVKFPYCVLINLYSIIPKYCQKS